MLVGNCEITGALYSIEGSTQIDIRDIDLKRGYNLGNKETGENNSECLHGIVLHT